MTIADIATYVGIPVLIVALLVALAMSARDAVPPTDEDGEERF